MFFKKKKIDLKWYCDNCTQFLNLQEGFSSNSKIYECKICGFKNDVSDANIDKDKCGPYQIIVVKRKAPRAEYNAKVSNLHYHFDGPISKEVFEKIAFECAKGINRLKIRIDGTKITGIVTTVSGTNDWIFSCDFDYYGKMTGNYRSFWSENEKSNIPSTYVRRMRFAIMDELASIGYENSYDFYCPKCGDDLYSQYSDIYDCFWWKCKKCGHEFELPLHRINELITIPPEYL